MRISSIAAVTLALVLAGRLPGVADPVAGADAPIVAVPGSEHFAPAPSPFPNGVMLAVLSGDPKIAGAPYTLRLKLADGVRLPVHTHGGIENVTVIKGTFLVAIGDTFDEAKLKPLPAGAYVSIPPNLAHYAMAKGVTIVDVSGVGPETTTFAK